jgi:hypothetical protein
MAIFPGARAMLKYVLILYKARYVINPVVIERISAFLWISCPRESRRKGNKGEVKSTLNQPLWRYSRNKPNNKATRINALQLNPRISIPKMELRSSREM